jgi:hypothetical protein
MTSIRTNETVLRALERASSYRLTAAEELQQRLSFVMAALPSENNMTREQVQEVLEHRGSNKSVTQNDSL